MTLIDPLSTQARLSCIHNFIGNDKSTNLSPFNGLVVHNDFGHSGLLKVITFVFALFHLRSAMLAVIVIVFSIHRLTISEGVIVIL
ncbi:MAG: hypothetical protein WCG25_09800 [bacterium]